MDKNHSAIQDILLQNLYLNHARPCNSMHFHPTGIQFFPLQTKYYKYSGSFKVLYTHVYLSVFIFSYQQDL